MTQCCIGLLVPFAARRNSPNGRQPTCKNELGCSQGNPSLQLNQPFPVENRSQTCLRIREPGPFPPRCRFGVTQLFTLAQAYLSLSGVSLKEGPEFQGLVACLFPSEHQILRWSQTACHLSQISLINADVPEPTFSFQLQDNWFIG